MYVHVLSIPMYIYMYSSIILCDSICLGSDGCVDGERRIVSRSDENGVVEGRVEVCFNGLWGAIYSDTWNQSHSGVICNGLGYEPSGTLAQCICCNKWLSCYLIL